MISAETSANELAPIRLEALRGHVCGAICNGNFEEIKRLEGKQQAGEMFDFCFMRMPTGESAVELALKKEESEIAVHFLSLQNTDINRKDGRSGKPLLLSAVQNLPVLRYLLQKPELQVNALDGRGYTALHEACRSNNLGALQVLLEHPKIDVNTQSCANRYNETPLTVAVRIGHTEIVQALLQHPHLQVNAQTTQGETAIEVAARRSRWHLMRLLLAHPNITPFLQNRKAWHANTVLHWAMSNQAPLDIVKHLVQHASHTAMNAHGKTPLMFATFRPVPSSSSKDDDVVQFLLGHDSVNVNAQDSSGNTVLHLCAARGRLLGMAQQILNHPDIQVSLEATNNKGETPLHIAVWEGNWQFLHHVLSKFPRMVNAKNARDSKSLLHLALVVKSDSDSMLECLLDHYDHLNLNAQDSKGDTPLHYASRSGQWLVVDRLLNHHYHHHQELNVSIQNSMGQTPAQVAKTLVIRKTLLGMELLQVSRALQAALDMQCFDVSAKENAVSIENRDMTIKMMLVLVEWLPWRL